MIGVLKGWARRAMLEQGTLLASLAKWTALATVVGVLAGGSTALFLWVLGLGIRGAASLPLPLLLLPPGFVVAHLIVRLFAREAEGHGTDKVIEAVHQRWGRISLLVAPVKLVATVVTIAAGGSVGKEGPAAQIGASLASGLASLLFLRRRDHRRLVICGIGAGFAAVFGTPIAGAVFGVEVLVMGSLFYEVLYPSFIAGIVSYFVTTSLGVTYFHGSLMAIPAITERVFLKVIASGIFFGLVALVLIESLRVVTAAFRRLPGPRWLVAGAGGLLLALLAEVFSTRYLGLGLESVESALRGGALPGSAFLLKVVFTAISLGAGGSGGIVTPIFFIGAASGNALAPVLGFDRGALSAIGMVSLLSAAANAPIAASVMALELFGPAIGPYAAISAIVSFLVVGHRSVYGSQLLGPAKSGSVKAPSDVEIDRLTGLEIRRRVARHRAVLRLLRRRRRQWRRRRPG